MTDDQGILFFSYS